jgi:hypothetical protein
MTYLASNPGGRVEMPGTNRLSMAEITVPDYFPLNAIISYILRLNFHIVFIINADHNGRAVCGMKCLRLPKRWDRGFESHSRHGCQYCMSSLCL